MKCDVKCDVKSDVKCDVKCEVKCDVKCDVKSDVQCDDKCDVSSIPVDGLRTVLLPVGPHRTRTAVQRHAARRRREPLVERAKGMSEATVWRAAGGGRPP